MNPATATLLRAVAALASHAQGHPTDAPGIRLRSVARSKAEAAWVQAGSPDLPPDGPRPAVIPRVDPRERQAEEAAKDWTPVTVLVEVKRVTEKAYLLDPGDGAYWCPKSVVRESDPDFPDVGDVATMTVPRWVLP
jgi:hypothetical protein